MIKLAISSKSADDVMRKVKVVKKKCSNNEVTLAELDKNLRQVFINPPKKQTKNSTTKTKPFKADD